MGSGRSYTLNREEPRYAAAVRLFSHLAALTAATLRIVESLRDSSALSIGGSPWDEDVVVGASEFVQEARVFVAPLGSATPDLRDSLALGEEWSAFTVTELLRQDPANHVRVTLRDEAGETIASHEAAVSGRKADETSAAWHVLVAGSVVFKFSFDLQDERMTDAHFLGWDAFDSTNELKLASTQLLIQLHHAAAMAFEVREQELITLGPPAFREHELEELEVIAQTAEDIVIIERISGQALDPCNARFDDRDRVRLRRARLTWEGRIVHAMRHPVIVTAPQGRPPHVIAITAGTIDVGGAKVPTLNTLMRHPDMTATETGTAPDAGPEAKTYKMQPPNGEQFFAWAPGRVRVSGDAGLAVTASWDLIGIDEATFSY